MSTVSLAASDRGAAVRIDRLFLGLALGATVVLIALVLLDPRRLWTWRGVSQG
jgi:hypothetical protein